MVDIGRLIFGTPEQNADLAPVHEDEALVLVCYIRAHTAPNDAMPSWKVNGIKLCLNNLRNVVENAALLKCESDTIDGMLLHVGVHVCVLNHSILRLLLIRATMRLHHLRVSLPFPLLSLVCPCIRCYLRH